MELFDGFIAAIASEFNIKFEKDPEENYITTIEFQNERKQDVSVSISIDESGDRIIHFVSNIKKLKKDSSVLYKQSLEINSYLDYGAIVLEESNLKLRNSILLHHCEPQRFMKNLLYIAAKADELEEKFTRKDTY